MADGEKRNLWGRVGPSSGPPEAWGDRIMAIDDQRNAAPAASIIKGPVTDHATERVSEPVAGLILAGGRSRRMAGRDKARLDLGGRPLLLHALAVLGPQVGPMAVAAGSDAGRLDDLLAAAPGVAVLADAPGAVGPLAGVLAGLDHVGGCHPACRWMASIPVDTPFLPATLVAALLAAARRKPDATVAIARGGGRTHPVVAVWQVDRADALRAALTGEGLRKVEAWTRRERAVIVDFPDPGAFLNLNTPEDVARALAARG